MFAVVLENVGFVLLCVAIVALIIGIAYLAERHFANARGEKRHHGVSNVRYMVTIAMLSAMAAVLMAFDFPLPFLPSFYKIDLSELPIIIGAFALGPMAGVIIEFIKVLLHLFIKGTSTAFVGDFANFLIGCAFVVPASIIYCAKKTKKHAVIGLVIGTIITAITGCLLNAYMLLPKYAEVFHMPIDALIAMGSEVNGLITNMFTFVALAVAPFNIIKCAINSLITILIYHKVSPILKGRQ